MISSYGEDAKNIEIIQRAKMLEGSLEKKTKGKSKKNTNRLYEESKRNNAIKDYLWKIR